METIAERIEKCDWEAIYQQMNNSGYAMVPGLLSKEECNDLIDHYQQPELFRKTVVMERYRFGLGEYKYLSYPLPGMIQSIRESVYKRLAPLANIWTKVLNMDVEFPEKFADLQVLCESRGQTKPTVLILKYGEGGHNTLHQDLYGELFFPIQVLLFLNEPGEDYTGGEFVLTQQTPRAQTKAMVLKPSKGDLLLFTTNFRPVKGARGYYRVNMKHGVSEVHSGTRYTLGIIFHDALT